MKSPEMTVQLTGPSINKCFYLFTSTGSELCQSRGGLESAAVQHGEAADPSQPVRQETGRRALGSAQQGSGRDGYAGHQHSLPGHTGEQSYGQRCGFGFLFVFRVS